MNHSSLDHKHEEMTTGSVPRLICKLAIPTIISMLITALYVMADTYFVGKINTQATAAVGVSFSIMAIIQAIGFFFGQGSGNYISRLLGAQDIPQAKRVAATGFFYAFASGVLITLIGLLFLSPICRLLGSTPTILPYAERYLGIILLGAPFSTSSIVLNNQMRFQGNALYSMYGIVVGAVLNTCLDPLLIFVCHMGISGAALSTIISQICSFCVLLYMDRRGTNIRIHPKNFSFSPTTLREIVFGGSPSLTRQGLASASTILLNVSAGAYGDAAIAGMGIVSRIALFIFSFVVGFGQGFQPVCGFNYGAGRYLRVRQGFFFCVRAGFVFLSLCTLSGWFFAPEIVSWFREGDTEVIAVGTAALRWQLIALPLNAWSVMSNMMLQTTRMAGRAVLLAAARQGLFFVPLILLLPACFGLAGVEACQALSDLCTFILAVPLALPVLQKFKQKGNLGSV